MTRDPVGRRGVGIADAFRRLDVGTILATILVLGLVLRVFIAGVYLPLSGFAIDVGDFSAWGQRLASVGPAHFYEQGYFSDYPPGYLYVLWVLGSIGGLLTPLVGQDATGGLVKIPGILADIGVAWMLFIIARRWGGELVSRLHAGISGETLGLAAAAIYLFNPGVVFDSAVWGQVDSVGALVLLGTIYALARGWTEVAALGAVVGMLVKFQFAFLIPVVAIVGIKRHLLGRSSDPRHAGRPDSLRVVTSLATGIVSVTLLLLPFGMFVYTPLAGGNPRGLLGILPDADPTTSLVGKLVEAATTYTGLSINAFNLWRNPWSGLGDTLTWGDDTGTALAIGSVTLTWQHIGFIAFGVVALIALWQVARRDDLRGLLLCSLVLAVAFFALPTRVHERYLFPALALSAPLLLAGRSWPWIVGGLSASFFANIYWVYTEDWSFSDRLMNPGANGAAMPQDGFLASTLFTDPGIYLLGLMITAILVGVVVHAVRLARAVPEIESDAEPVRSEPRSRAPAPTPWVPRPRRSWLSPNPADAYLREPMRGLNRRDALICLGLILFAFVFRLWRLDLPRSQHFDEVYHARSAAEFLSAWENGYDRDVYEWTHPMLAKYLIAAGIVAIDPNKVVGSRSLDAPSAALAVAPARALLDRPRSVAFTTDGMAGITATDAQTGDELASWGAGGPVATMAWDEDGARLLVGRADDGIVESYDVGGILTGQDDRAPPATGTITADLRTVDEIFVPTSGTEPLVLRGNGGIAVVDRATDQVTVSATGSYGGIGIVHGQEAEDPDWVVATDTDANAIVYLDLETLQPREGDELRVDAPLIGPLIVRGGGDDQLLIALTAGLPADDEHAATPGGAAAIDADEAAGECNDQSCFIGLVPLPVAPVLIADQRVAGLVYVAGMTAAGEPEAVALEPHVEERHENTIGLAAYDTASLPGTPLAMAFDVASTSQGDDHGRLVVSTAAADGRAELVRVDAGSNAFSWRISGVIFGSILVGLIYLLGATMFGRRRIGLLAAAFVAIDGMSFVMSRISMNDIFVATFIVAAYLVFWQIWSGRWLRSAWWALPLVGVLIGLAAASKWVGFYALAGLWVLVLARSALGRLVLVGLIAIATVVGAIGAPWPFLVVMLGILALALVIVWARPVRIDMNDVVTALPATAVVLTGIGLAFVLAFGQVEGARTPGNAVEYLFGLLARGAQVGWPAWLMMGVAAVLIAWRAALSLLRPRSDARWWQPAEMGGFAWSWVFACLVVVPLVVYALSYIPYLQLGHDWAIGGGPGYGWSLDELHAQMFSYHFNLKAGHASASPWWSWPLMLKPTWFYSGSFDNDQIAVIYNGGNPILFWAGIPALVACAVLAWKRRSLALVLIVAAFAFQYVPWIRIERATFAYHYLTAVLFAMIAVAYCVDELLRRPAWRDLAIGYLVLVVLVGVLIFPLGSALPMPDWYINAARSLPPWNFDFKFPDPPAGERAQLIAAGAVKAALGVAVAVGAMVFAVVGRRWWERRSEARVSPPEVLSEGS